MKVKPIKLGILGCASVSDYAILDPARKDNALLVEAVASRNAERAAKWASERGIPKSFGSYQALLEAGLVNAIYVPLPNSMHCEWVIRALKAGYPVLCEKPLASNTAQAAQMAEVARETGRPLVEAFHWRHHPFVARMAEILDSGEIGAIRHIESRFRINHSLVAEDNIRNDYQLGGGVTMDQGCYCISITRYFAGAEPERVVAAVAHRRSSEIDDAMVAELAFPGGISARVDISMIAEEPGFSCATRIEGTGGSLTITNPFLTQQGSCIEVETGSGNRIEEQSKVPSYIFQARDFAALVRGENPVAILPPEDGVANLKVIDAIYTAAGMSPRP